MSRGGPRNGTAGKLYPNRSDLSSPTAHQIPAKIIQGGEQGSGVAQQNALKAIPMATGPIGIGNAQPPQINGAPDPTQAPPYTGSTPGSLPDLFRPTERPNEHFMTGVNAGPGQGSEALAPNPFINTAATQIQQALAQAPDQTPAVKFVQTFLAMQQANQAPSAVLGQ